MDKSGNQIGVNPLTKISPLSAVAPIGNPAQALESRAEHLAKQQAGFLAKMTLTHLKSLPEQATSTASVSAAAKLIDQSLKQAEANGLAAKYIAHAPITHNPKNPDIVSQQLKAAISNSGLFYESHLRAFVEGHRQLAMLKQEPQNQLQNMAQTLLPQQLHILEHQRLSWHGEAWPNQKMDWDVYTQNQQENQERNPYQGADEQTAIASDITLHLPNLGKVTAKISIKSGRMHIGIQAEQKASLQLLREKSPSLTSAIESTGQKLEGLTLETLTTQTVAANQLRKAHSAG